MSKKVCNSQEEQDPEADENFLKNPDYSESSVEKILCDRVAILEAEIEALKDQNLRIRAEGENFRRRILREREDAVTYANRALIIDILEILDNFDRALQLFSRDNTGKEESVTSMFSGIEIIRDDFLKLLEKKWGLKCMEKLEGSPFDPQSQEAYLREITGDYSVETVVEVLRKGYFLHDRVLRSAKVRVAVPE